MRESWQAFLSSSVSSIQYQARCKSCSKYRGTKGHEPATKDDLMMVSAYGRLVSTRSKDANAEKPGSVSWALGTECFYTTRPYGRACSTGIWAPKGQGFQGSRKAEGPKATRALAWLYPFVVRCATVRFQVRD